MNPINKLINNRAIALFLIVIITITLIRFHQITGYITETATNPQSLSSYIPILLIAALIILYLIYKKN